MARTKASAKIWNKFSAEEKRLWRMFYSDFIWVLGKVSHIKIKRHDILILAHNLACHAIWDLTERTKN